MTSSIRTKRYLENTPNGTPPPKRPCPASEDRLYQKIFAGLDENAVSDEQFERYLLELNGFATTPQKTAAVFQRLITIIQSVHFLQIDSIRKGEKGYPALTPLGKLSMLQSICNPEVQKEASYALARFFLKQEQPNHAWDACPSEYRDQIQEEVESQLMIVKINRLLNSKAPEKQSLAYREAYNYCLQRQDKITNIYHLRICKRLFLLLTEETTVESNSHKHFHLKLIYKLTEQYLNVNEDQKKKMGTIFKIAARLYPTEVSDASTLAVCNRHKEKGELSTAFLTALNKASERELSPLTLPQLKTYHLLVDLWVNHSYDVIPMDKEYDSNTEIAHELTTNVVKHLEEHLASGQESDQEKIALMQDTVKSFRDTFPIDTSDSE